MKLEPKPIPGFEDRYYLDPDIMRVVNKKTGRPLKPTKDGSGYAEVQLWKNNKGTHKTMHRLFAEAYIPNPDNLPDINHKDENTMNFELDNLEWCTKSYNQNYGTINERRGPKTSAKLRGRERPIGSGRPAKPVIVTDPWGNETRYPSGREAARQLGIRQSGITGVLSGERKTTHGLRVRYE